MLTPTATGVLRDAEQQQEIAEDDGEEERWAHAAKEYGRTISPEVWSDEL